MPRSPRQPKAQPLTRDSFTSDLVDEVLAELPSPHSRRSYSRAFEDLFAFLGKRHVTVALLLAWRDALRKKLTPASVNLRLTATRKLLRAAYRRGLTREADLYEIPRLRALGRPTGNWLTTEQCRRFLAVPNRRTLKGKRTYCILAMLLGCALRRTELVELQLEQIQMRDSRWVVTNLRGKGGRVRTVAVPVWVKEAIDAWTKARGITSGFLICRLSTAEPLSTSAVWRVVQKCAGEIDVPNLGPHDLRRTCARLARARGARLEAIKDMLGHSSIATTERYLGSVSSLKHAPNDNLGIWSDAA